MASSIAEVPPTAPDGPSTWMGSDLASSPERWVRHWTEHQLDDLLELSRRHLHDDLTALDLGNDVPDSLSRLAADVRAELVDGLGFTLIKGYPVGRIDRRLEAVGFLVVGRLLGTLRSQNAGGHLLGHVKDVGGDLADPGTRIYQTNERQSFHTDSTDCVVLLCRATAQSGGRSLLVSAETAYQIMVDERPDLTPFGDPYRRRVHLGGVHKLNEVREPFGVLKRCCPFAAIGVDVRRHIGIEIGSDAERVVDDDGTEIVQTAF